MKKKLLLQLVKTFIIGSFASVLLLHILYSQQSKSLEGGQGLIIMCMAAIFFNLLLCVSACTIFLQLQLVVKTNTVYSLLSYFLLPILICIWVLIKDETHDMWKAFFGMSSPFFCVHIYHFIKQKRTNITTD
jgi:hypothetical protein